jgi:hypothetical protein
MCHLNGEYGEGRRKRQRFQQLDARFSFLKGSF